MFARGVVERSRRGGWCWCAIAWASSRCIFARRGGEIYFGSELKTILLHPEIERRIERRRPRPLSFAQLRCPAAHTLVEGIEKLPPGNWLEWPAAMARSAAILIGSCEFRPDTRIDLDVGEARNWTGCCAASVREHLVSDVPLGVWSSGGLDSSTILHYAAEASPSKPQDIFGFLSRTRVRRERLLPRSRRDSIRTDHHEFDLNPDRDSPSAIEQFAYYSDEPSADAGALPVWFLSKMCRSEVTVALSGDGADELFGGYNTYLADRYARTLRMIPDAAAQGRRARRTVAAGIGSKRSAWITRSRECWKARCSIRLTRTFSGTERFRRSAETRVLAARICAPSRPIRLPVNTAGIGYLNRFLWLDQTALPARRYPV